MVRLGNFLKKFLPGRNRSDPSEVESLRLDFKERYRNFKQLISANNKALEIMADIEQALQGERPFGMTFVRSSVTAVSVSVFRMIRKMNLLAPGKYAELEPRFEEIKAAVDSILSRSKPIQDDRLVIPLDAINKEMADIVGGKMANLGELRNRLGLRVPPGFVVTAAAYQRFVEHNDLRAEINRRLQTADADNMEGLYNLHARLNRLIVEAEMPPELEAAMRKAWQRIEDEAGGNITVALRSSALGEDEAGASFAGMHRSELNVSAEHLFVAYKEVVASKYSLQAITYRLKKGFKDEEVAMCVGCLVMVDAKAGGVMYSRNPIDIQDEAIYINSAWGLPKAIVDGTIDCDLFAVGRAAPMAVIHSEIQDKERKFICYAEEGVCRIDLTLDDNRMQPSIDAEQAVALAETAVEIEAHYGSAQDIEWAIDQEDRICVLQCRPLQQSEAIGTEKISSLSGRELDDAVVLRGGITASPGAAAGPVHRLERGIDLLQFPEGAILVTAEALPRWASLVSRAAGIITEHGSFAGHLANVAREFGVPALFGLSGAMAAMENGLEITLDAGSRAVYRGRIDSLLTGRIKREGLMAGSPVYETLKAAAAYITPLNLLDPASSDFTPANCRSLHDITRFIHEKSVKEMFNFGREHNFSERSSKQLHYKVPMQWWILNLDDGFKTEIKGKYVKLDQIDSIPMLAFWEGFAAVSWEGPPAIDGKGLMSVMFQSTTNPSLNTGVRSRFADQNYFMISKHFCNLNSRLGYHFSTLEALVGDRREENYIKFQFKGGAADFDRRFRRAHFIAELLEDYGFKTEIIEDNVEARIEGHDAEYMKQRLEILGYLSLHTRQLDMIMTREAMVKYYRDKFHKDIDYLLNEHTRRFYR